MSRSALAVLALIAYGVAAGGAPVYSAKCGHHTGAHGARAAEGHASHAAPHDDAPRSAPEHGPCTCLGICQGTATFALPAVGVSRPLVDLRIASALDAAPSAFDLPSHPPFTLPYANAPPPTV